MKRHEVSSESSKKTRTVKHSFIFGVLWMPVVLAKFDHGVKLLLGCLKIPLLLLDIVPAFTILKVLLKNFTLFSGHQDSLRFGRRRFSGFVRLLPVSELHKFALVLGGGINILLWLGFGLLCRCLVLWCCYLWCRTHVRRGFDGADMLRREGRWILMN